MNNRLYYSYLKSQVIVSIFGQAVQLFISNVEVFVVTISESMFVFLPRLVEITVTLSIQNDDPVVQTAYFYRSITSLNLSRQYFIFVI